MSDEPRRAIFITCPDSGQGIPTGAYATEAEFEQTAKSKWAFVVPCIACESEHEVTGEDTFLGDETFAAD